jgi:ribose transport system substrate-binding protein
LKTQSDVFDGIESSHFFVANAGSCRYTLLTVKTPIKVGLLVSGALALASFAMSVSLVRELLRSDTINEAPGKISHHVSLYIPGNRSDYFDDLVAGARRAARAGSIALSVHRIDDGGKNLALAMYAGTDGIIVCPTSDDAVTNKCLFRLSDGKIPVVLANHNVSADKPWPFVGTNNFDFGKRAGAIVRQQYPAGVRLAVVYSDKSPAIYAERELVEMGLSASLGDGLKGAISGLKTDMNPRDAEKAIYRLVREAPDINVIVFTDSDDTIAGTQALIELNMVGRVGIVGTGDSKEILDYIGKGIINGSLVIHPDAIGAQAVKSVAELISSGYTSQSVDTGIDVISSETLARYLYSGEKKER